MRHWSEEEKIAHTRIVGGAALALIFTTILPSISNLLMAFSVALLAVYWFWPEKAIEYFSFGLKK